MYNDKKNGKIGIIITIIILAIIFIGMVINRQIEQANEIKIEEIKVLGKRTKDIKKGNFLTYVDRSKKEYGDLGRMEEQVKNSWKYMSNRLVKIKK